MNIGLGLFPGFVINQEVRGDYFAVFATTSQFTFSIVCVVCIKSGAEKVKKHIISCLNRIDQYIQGAHRRKDISSLREQQAH